MSSISTTTPATARSRSRVPFWSVAAVAGLGAGALAKIADEAAGGSVAQLGTSPALWTFLVVLIGWGSLTRVRAALSAAVFFSAMCAAYYLWATQVLDFPMTRRSYLWFALALTAVPVAAATTSWMRQRGDALVGAWLGLAAAAVLSDGAVRTSWFAATGQLGEDSPTRAGQTVLELLLVAALVLLPRRWRASVVAVAVLVPAALVLMRVVEPVQSAWGLT